MVADISELRSVCTDQVLGNLAEHSLEVDWILETHAHADHLSGARYLQQRVGGRIAIGENIRAVQATFKDLYNLERSFLPDGSQFDHLFKDGETFRIGEDEFVAMRQARDATLEVPTLILPSIQVNVRAGQLPPPDENGVSYLRIPLNTLPLRP